MVHRVEALTQGRRYGARRMQHISVAQYAEQFLKQPLARTGYLQHVRPFILCCLVAYQHPKAQTVAERRKTAR